MRTTYIGHATLLLQIGDQTILTDPNFDTHLGWVLKRVSLPGIALDALPKLNALLLTHAHADHLSFESLKLLPRDIPLFAPPPVARWLIRLGFRHAVPLAAGEDVAVGEVTITAAAATHLGARYSVDRWRNAANMYLLATGERSLFFAGDTALTPDSHRLVESLIHERGRTLDVALLPIGHAPDWKRASFRKGHLTSEDALDLFERLGARYLVPYHWGTFNHVTVNAHEAIIRLRGLLETDPRAPGVRILEPGQTLDVSL